MQNLILKKGIVSSLILLFFGMNIIPVVTIVKADIIWEATLNFNEPGGVTDYVVFGEASDANDGPPSDIYDVAKPLGPISPYIRAYLDDNLPSPYTDLGGDYRQFPDTGKIWNLSVQWVPEDGESPSTITISWSISEVDESEYTTVNLCTDAGVVLKNMLVDTTYSFNAFANVVQKFKIICTSPGNQPPVANPDSHSTNEDTTLTIVAPGVLENDNDSDGDPLTAVKQSEPSHGNVTLNSNGGYTYIPTTNYFGSDSFTYKAYDGNLYSTVATVTITVNAVNDAPVVTNIPDQTIMEGSTFSMITLDTYVSDADNVDAQMTWTYSGTVQLTVSIVNRVATITTPNEDWDGAETITFKATDPDGLWDDDPATFTVTAVNTPPVVGDIPDQMVAEGSTFSTIALDNYVTDEDNTDAQMTWTYSGTVQLTVNIVNRIAMITIPNTDWYGSETITFRAVDPGGLWAEDLATFTVTPVNDAPVVSDISGQTIAEGSSFTTITLDNYVTDIDNLDSQMTWTYSGNVQLLVSIVNRVATITTPHANWYGSETITFSATDPGGLWDDDPATFTVTAVNDPPVAGDIPSQTILEGSTFSTITLDNYVSDAENTDAQMTWTYSGTSQLTVSIVSRVATITIPNANWYGSETVTFRATDPGGLWDEDPATFTVTNVNASPVVTNIPDQMIPEGSTFSTIPLDTYVSDVDNTDTQMTWTYSGNSQLTVSIVNRVATITIPNSDWTGAATITFRAADPGGLWDNDPATFTVTAVNDPPVVNDIPNQTILEGSTFSTIPLDTYVSDVDNTDTQMSWTSSGNTQLSVSIVNRIALITIPNTDWYGSETITFRASDLGGLWDDDSAIFTVTAGNAPPNAPSTPSPVNGASGVSITVNLGWADGDPDGDPVLYDVSFGASGSPSIVSHNQSGLSYDLRTLSYSTTYYWKIVAWDNHSISTIGPVWHFTTAPQSGGGGGGGDGGGEEPPASQPNKTPLANVSAGEPYQGFVNSEILFDGSRSYDPDGNITIWSWGFGDNTNGTEKTVTHTYLHTGAYNVTLTVTDNDGATNTDTTTCVIIQPNRPPLQPIITGPTKGTKNIPYTYSVVSTDVDNDTIQYTFEWENSLIQPSRFLPSATVFSVNHSWDVAGRYHLTVIVTDNQTLSSSELFVYIDAVPANGIGYLLDNDSNGIYDAFYSDELQQTLTIQKEDDLYHIDSDGGGDWDYTYTATNGFEAYKEPPGTYGVEIIIGLIAIALYLFWRRKPKKEK